MKQYASALPTPPPRPDPVPGHTFEADPYAGARPAQTAALRAAIRRSGGSVGGGWLRGGSPASSSLVASVTVRTACSNAASVRGDTVWTPLTLRTYWRAAASISSLVAAGSRPRSVVMLRHMPSTLPWLSGAAPAPRGPSQPGAGPLPSLGTT